MNNFVMIPNWYVHNYNLEEKQGGETLMNSNNIGDKIIATILWIDTQAIFVKNKFIFTLNELIKGCGYKPTKGKGKSIEQFQLCLKWLEDNDIITFIKGSTKSIGEEMIEIYYEPNCEKDLKGKNIRFTRVPKELVNKIFLECKNKEIINCLVILTLICKMLKTNESEVEKNYKEGNWKQHKNETAKLSFVDYVLPAFGDKMSERNWRKYTKLMEEKGIIYKVAMRNKNGNNEATIYALDEQNIKQRIGGELYIRKEHEEEIEEDIEEIKEENNKVINIRRKKYF